MVVSISIDEISFLSFHIEFTHGSLVQLDGREPMLKSPDRIPLSTDGHVVHDTFGGERKTSAAKGVPMRTVTFEGVGAYGAKQQHLGLIRSGGVFPREAEVLFEIAFAVTELLDVFHVFCRETNLRSLAVMIGDEISIIE